MFFTAFTFFIICCSSNGKLIGYQEKKPLILYIFLVIFVVCKRDWHNKGGNINGSEKKLNTLEKETFFRYFLRCGLIYDWSRKKKNYKYNFWFTGLKPRWCWRSHPVKRVFSLHVTNFAWCVEQHKSFLSFIGMILIYPWAVLTMFTK